MTSWQTTTARRDAERLDADWRDHKRHCSTCSIAAAKRRLDEVCNTGARIVCDRRNAHEQLRTEQEADAKPNPLQASMF